MKLEELKPCPFCGGEAKILPEGDYHEVTCLTCGVSKTGHTYQDAVDCWNARAAIAVESRQVSGDDVAKIDRAIELFGYESGFVISMNKDTKELFEIAVRALRKMKGE